MFTATVFYQQHDLDENFHFQIQSFFSNLRKYLGRIFTDSLVHDKDALELLVKVIGEGQVMLGTDYPFPLGELDCGKLIEGMDTFDHSLKVSFPNFKVYFKTNV